MIAYDYYTFVPLYDCCEVTFVYGICTLITGKTKYPGKQTNETVTRLTKKSFKKKLKNTFI